MSVRRPALILLLFAATRIPLLIVRAPFFDELFNLLAAHAASALQGAWLAAELKGRAPHLWAAADQV